MKENSIRQKIAILSISLILTSNSIISGSLVYIQEAFNLTRNEAEFIISLSSLAVMIFIFLAEYLAIFIGIKIQFCWDFCLWDLAELSHLFLGLIHQ